MESCCASSSSNLMRSQAGCARSASASSSIFDGGLCSSCTLSAKGGSLSRSSKACGSVSDNSSSLSAERMYLPSVACGSPAVVGYTGVSDCLSGVSSPAARHADALAYGKLLLLAGIKIQEAQM